MILLRQKYFSEAGKRKLEERALKKANKQEFYRKLLEKNPDYRFNIEQNVEETMRRFPNLKRDMVEEKESLREARKLSRKDIGGQIGRREMRKKTSPSQFMKQRKEEAASFAKLPRYEDNSIIGRAKRKIRGPKFKDISRKRQAHLHVRNITKSDKVARDIYKHIKLR